VRLGDALASGKDGSDMRLRDALSAGESRAGVRLDEVLAAVDGWTALVRLGHALAALRGEGEGGGGEEEEGEGVHGDVERQ
jgi:hypothetical protein